MDERDFNQRFAERLEKQGISLKGISSLDSDPDGVGAGCSRTAVFPEIPHEPDEIRRAFDDRDELAEIFREGRRPAECRAKGIRRDGPDPARDFSFANPRKIGLI